MKVTKEVSYSYPTSENATTFGYADIGCYTIGLVRHRVSHQPGPFAIAAFATKKEAIAFAKHLKFEWSYDPNKV